MSENYKLTSMSVKEHLRSKSMWGGGKLTIDHIIRELYDNQIDEVIAGHADTILIKIDDNKLIFIDNGRGLPRHEMEIELADKSKMKIDSIVATFTQLFVSGKHDDSNYKIKKGVNGVGLKLTCSLSKLLICKVKDKIDPFIYHEYEFIDFNHEIKYKQVKSDTKITFSTWIEFNLDKSQFASMSYNKINVMNRLSLAKAKFPKSNIIFNNSKIETQTLQNFVKNYLMLNNDNKIDSVTYTDSVDTFTTYFTFDFKQNINLKYASCNMDFVGGKFLGVIETKIFDWVKEVFEIQDLTKKDILDSLKLYVDAELSNPIYVGQTKDAIENELGAKFHTKKEEVCKLLKKNVELKEQIAKILEDKKNKELVTKERKRKKSLDDNIKHTIANVLPGNILYITEGDSAGGQVVKCRENKTEGVFKSGGKIPNVLKMNNDAILRSTKILSLFDAIGFDFENYILNKPQTYNYKYYGILVDADEDGLHIGALNAFIFWKFMKDLIIQKRVHIILAPLYNGVGSDGLTVPLYTEQQCVGYKNIRRFKGLGEMSVKNLDFVIRNGYKLTLTDNIENTELLDILDIDKKRVMCYSGKYGYQILIDSLAASQ